MNQLCNFNIKISIKSPSKKRRGAVNEPATIIQVANPSDIPVAPAVVATTEKADPIQDAVSAENDNSNYVTIKASMIGTFYRSTSPDSPPFVNVGDSIGEGDTLCIIEAMKLFNEIESEVSGKIIKVLVDDATPIEFDQPLFLIDPS